MQHDQPTDPAQLAGWVTEELGHAEEWARVCNHTRAVGPPLHSPEGLSDAHSRNCEQGRGRMRRSGRASSQVLRTRNLHDAWLPVWTAGWGTDWLGGLATQLTEWPLTRMVASLCVLARLPIESATRGSVRCVERYWMMWQGKSMLCGRKRGGVSVWKA